MKKNNLNMLVKASVRSGKLWVGFFCFFITVAAVLILVSVSIIIPLAGNIKNNVNNHISKRELITEFSVNLPRETVDEKIEKIRKVEHVTDVYRMPSQLIATEDTGILHGNYNIGFVHNGFSPVITSGRIFNESESGVAIVPQTIKDFNPSDNKIHEIIGESLVGQSLVLTDILGNKHSIKVVGAYNTSDPIFSGDEILVPQADLLEYDEMTESGDIQGVTATSDYESYIILIDSAKNTEGAQEETSYINNVRQSNSDIDSDSYNTALYIMIAALAIFIILAVIGLFMFLKSNIDNRTEEFALYRSLGYKSKHIFSVVFTEHFIFGIASIAAGIIITLLLLNFVVNPYLYTIAGNTLMEIKAEITVAEAVCLILLFTAILIAVCKKAVSRSEKIDLTVLLREQ